MTWMVVARRESSLSVHADETIDSESGTLMSAGQMPNLQQAGVGCGYSLGSRWAQTQKSRTA